MAVSLCLYWVVLYCTLSYVRHMYWKQITHQSATFIAGDFRGIYRKAYCNASKTSTSLIRKTQPNYFKNLMYLFWTRWIWQRRMLLSATHFLRYNFLWSSWYVEGIWACLKQKFTLYFRCIFRKYFHTNIGRTCLRRTGAVKKEIIHRDRTLCFLLHMSL